MSLSSLTSTIDKANAAGRFALIPFITAGFPDLERFWTILDELDAGGADIIEIGVPFSDPVADGPVVEAASQRALENGVTLNWILKELAGRKGRYRAGLVLMGYYNPFLHYGLERFAAAARAAGVSGCVVPDLPFEEAGPMRAALEAQGLSLIPLVGLNTSEQRMAGYAKSATGYAYLVSVLGTTGERGAFPKELEQALNLAQKTFSIPVALGFGISTPEQVEAMPIKPKAVVFGSALLQHLNKGESAANFMRRWQAGKTA